MSTTPKDDHAIIDKGVTSWEALMPDCCIACFQLGNQHRRAMWWAGFIGGVIGSACASIGKAAVTSIMDGIRDNIISKLPDS